MTKTPDEIKKGLECYINHGECHKHPRCDGCPYKVYTPDEVYRNVPIADALALIQQLEAGIAEWEDVAVSPGAIEDMARENTELLKKVELLQAERDAAVADLAHVKDCDTCKYDNACLTGKKDCFGCHAKGCPCLTCQYEWRGVQKEE